MIVASFNEFLWREQWPFKWMPNENVIASTEQRLFDAPSLLQFYILGMKTNSKLVNLQGLFFFRRLVNLEDQLHIAVL